MKLNLLCKRLFYSQGLTERQMHGHAHIQTQIVTPTVWHIFNTDKNSCEIKIK